MEKQNEQFVNLLTREMQIRNYSQRTIKTYRQLIYLLMKNTDVSLDQLSIDGFKEFLQKKIIDKGLSTSTINQLISVFKLLWVDVFARDWEAFKIKRPRREKKLPVILSLSEVEKLFSSTANIKHKAILMLTYSAGLRKSEVIDLKPSAIDSARMQVRVVQGKGKKDRYSILSPKVLEILRFYYKLERPAKFLFEPNGNKGKALSNKTLDSIIKKNSAKAGITKNVSFHTLRHCFATHLLEAGVNLRLIQQLMGHNSIRTTSGYLHLANISPSSIISPLDAMDI